jgi:hypothetical protein
MQIRLVFVQGILAGIEGATLFFAILLQYLGIAELQFGIQVTYYISLAMLGILILLSVINSFTQKVFVHPDDKLFGNIFCFILFMAEVLSFGHFFTEFQKLAYDAGVSVLTIFVFVYLVLFFGKSIGFHDLLDNNAKREKELIARFILFSILLGAILVALKFFYDWIYLTLGYGWGVFAIGMSTAAVIFFVGFLAWKKYEPISSS